LPDPIEQWNAEVGFQRVNLPRECRLNHVQARRRTGEAADIGNGGEGAQVTELHSAMITILHR
jgi:hypothetical protein